MSTPEDPAEDAADSVPGGAGGDVAVADAEPAPETRPAHPTLPTADPDAVPERSRATPREYAERALRSVWWRAGEAVRHPTPGMLLGVVYVLFAAYTTHGILFDPHGGILQDNGYDQQYFEWQLEWVKHALFSLQDPLFSHTMNAPDGMNVMANPQVLGPAFVLVPVTALFGPAVSFALLLFANLALTGITWRWFLRRNVVRSEAAAFVGGLFMGFSPSMISHSLAHPDLTGQWLVPIILDRVLRLRTPGRSVRDGVILGLLIAAQVFVGEELLFLTALTIAFFVIAFALQSPRTVWKAAPTFLHGTGVAILTAGTLLAYPLSFQFYGSMSFKGIPFATYYYIADLKTYLMYPSVSLWGDPDKTDKMVPGMPEQAALFGWALVLLVVAFSVLYIRSMVVRSALLATIPLVLLSLGPTTQYDGKPMPSPLGPSGVWNSVDKWPLFASSLPLRSAMAVSWLVGILLTIGIDRAVWSRHNMLRGVAFGLSFCALLPLTPRVLRVVDRAPVPAFFTDGAWKSCLPLGHTIVGVPLSSGGDRTNLVWETAADEGFNIPQGPVMAPRSPTDKQVVWGRENVLWTAQWLSYINNNGGASTPPMTQQIKDQVSGDLHVWDAGCVVVADDNPRLQDLKTFLDGALGSGTENGGVYVWRRSV